MKLKIILFQFLAIAVLAYFLFQKPEVETEVKTQERIVKVIDTVFKSEPEKIKEVFVKVPEVITKVVHDTVYLNKKVKEYVYKDTIKTAKITSTIIADNIYSRSLRVDLSERQIRTQITRTVSKNRFYVGNTATFGSGKSIETMSLNGFLSTKKLLIGAGIGLNFETGTPIVPITLAYKF